MVQVHGERPHRGGNGASVGLPTAAPPDAGHGATAWWMTAMGVASMAFPALSLVAFLMHARPGAASREHLLSEPQHPAHADIDAPRSIAGRVLDANGRPLAQAKVRLLRASAPQEGASQGNQSASAAQEVATTESDARGHFAFAVDALGTFFLRAEKSGHGAIESAELDAAPTASLVLVLLPLFAVTGRITDARGRPVPGAMAKLWGGSPAGEWIANANEDGWYSLAGVPPGERRLTAWARGFSPRTSELAVRWSSVERDVRLSMSPAIRGAVLDPDGHPVATAHLSACAGDDAEQALTDEQGRFELPPTTVGCTVTAHHPRFAASRPIMISSSGRVDVRLEPGGSIDGRATDERGRALASFSVTITSFDPAPGELSEARVGERRDELRGAFRFDDLAPGEYGVTVEAEGNLAWSSVIHVAAGKVSRGVHAVLAADDEVTTAAGETGEVVVSDSP